MSPVSEARPGVSAALERLRDVSRLTLDAIERDDVGALENCANECDAIVRALCAEEGGFGDEETRGLLVDVKLMNGRILERVREERDRLAEELVRVGVARARLAASRIESPPDEVEDEDAGLDREA